MEHPGTQLSTWSCMAPLFPTPQVSFFLTSELQLALLASVLRPQGASLLDSELIEGLRESQRQQPTIEGAEQESMAPDQRNLGAGREK